METKRTCIKCRREFKSQSVGNRLCNRCKERNGQLPRILVNDADHDPTDETIIRRGRRIRKTVGLT